MEKNEQRVREILVDKVSRWDYWPSYDMESALDHDTYWLALPKDEFLRVRSEAKKLAKIR